MRTITDTYEVFKFGELTETAKSKAIENVEIALSDCFQENFNYILEDIITYDFPNSNMAYNCDLSYCQGDYFSFNGDIAFIDVWNKINKDNYTENEINFLSDYLKGYYYKLESWNNKYKFILRYDKYDYILDLLYNDYENYYFDDSENCTPQEIFECKTLEKFENDFYEYMSNLTVQCKEIGYNTLYPNENEIIEMINENDYEFLENGKIYY